MYWNEYYMWFLCCALNGKANYHYYFEVRPISMALWILCSHVGNLRDKVCSNLNLVHKALRSTLASKNVNCTKFTNFAVFSEWLELFDHHWTCSFAKLLPLPKSDQSNPKACFIALGKTHFLCQMALWFWQIFAYRLVIFLLIMFKWIRILSHLEGLMEKMLHLPHREEKTSTSCLSLRVTTNVWKTKAKLVLPIDQFFFKHGRVSGITLLSFQSIN